MLQSMESQSQTRHSNNKVMYRCCFSKGLSNSSQSGPRKVLILSLELPSHITTRINLLGWAAVRSYPQAHQDSLCPWPPWPQRFWPLLVSPTCLSLPVTLQSSGLLLGPDQLDPSSPHPGLLSSRLWSLSSLCPFRGLLWPPTLNWSLLALDHIPVLFFPKHIWLLESIHLIYAYVIYVYFIIHLFYKEVKLAEGRRCICLCLTPKHPWNRVPFRIDTQYIICRLYE